MIKKVFLSLMAIFAISASVSSAVAQSSNPEHYFFNKHFYNKTMRYDFIHAGSLNDEHYYFQRLVEEPFYAGSKVELVDTLLGNQMFKVLDAASGELLYAMGYNTLFNEWFTTEESATMKKAYPESVLFPYPKNKVILEIYARGKDCKFYKKATQEIDPDSYFIQKSRGEKLPFFDVHYSGPSENKIDILLLGEGYTEGQRAKFEADCKLFADALFSKEPFTSQKKKFNIRAVWSPSVDEGATSPGENIWKNTAIESSFYTFDMERYIMVDDYQKIRDVAANAPSDVIYILANTPKYGGGALYNFYGISGSGHPQWAANTYVHEMGHLLAGLADEYQGGVAYGEIYPLNVEPWEQNITTLVDFDQKKANWKAMLPAKTQIPTVKKQDVGLYEGGGYVDKGIYRPVESCLMRSHGEFCPVCVKAIMEVIEKKTR